MLRLKTAPRVLPQRQKDFALRIIARHTGPAQQLSDDAALIYLLPAQMQQQNLEELFSCLELLARLMNQPAPAPVSLLSNLFCQVRCLFSIQTGLTSRQYHALIERCDHLLSQWRTPGQADAARRMLMMVWELKHQARASIFYRTAPELRRPFRTAGGTHMALQSMNGRLAGVLSRWPDIMKQEHAGFFHMLFDNTYRLQRLNRLRDFWRARLSLLNQQEAGMLAARLPRDILSGHAASATSDVSRERLIHWAARAGEGELRRLDQWVAFQARRAETVLQRGQTAQSGTSATWMLRADELLMNWEKEGKLSAEEASELRQQISQILRTEGKRLRLLKQVAEFAYGAAPRTGDADALGKQADARLEPMERIPALEVTLLRLEAAGALSDGGTEILRRELRELLAEERMRAGLSAKLLALERGGNLSVDENSALRGQIEQAVRAREIRGQLLEKLAALTKGEPLLEGIAAGLNRRLEALRESDERAAIWEEALVQLETTGVVPAKILESLHSQIQELSQKEHAQSGAMTQLAQLERAGRVSPREISALQLQIERILWTGEQHGRLIERLTDLTDNRLSLLEKAEAAAPKGRGDAVQRLDRGTHSLTEMVARPETLGGLPANEQEELHREIRELFQTGNTELDLLDRLADLEKTGSLSQREAEALWEQVELLRQVQQDRGQLEIWLARMEASDQLLPEEASRFREELLQPRITGEGLIHIEARLTEMSEAGSLPDEAAEAIRRLIEQVFQAEQAVFQHPENEREGVRTVQMFADRFFALPEDQRRKWMDAALEHRNFAFDFLDYEVERALKRDGPQTIRTLSDLLSEQEPMLSSWLELTAADNSERLDAFARQQAAAWEETFEKWSRSPKLRAWQTRVLPEADGSALGRPGQPEYVELRWRVFRKLLEQGVREDGGWTESDTLLHWIQQGLVLDGIRENTTAETVHALFQQQHRFHRGTILAALQKMFSAATPSPDQLWEWIHQADATLLNHVSSYLIDQAERGEEEHTPEELHLAERLEQILYTAPQTDRVNAHQQWQSEQIRSQLEAILTDAGRIPKPLTQLFMARQDGGIWTRFAEYLHQSGHLSPAKTGHLLAAFPTLSGELRLIHGAIRPDAALNERIQELPERTVFEIRNSLRLVLLEGLPNHASRLGRELADEVHHSLDGGFAPQDTETVLASGSPPVRPSVQMEFSRVSTVQHEEAFHQQQEQLVQFRQQMSLYERQLSAIREQQEKLLGEVLRKADQAAMEQRFYDRIDEDIRLAARRHGFT